MVEAFILEPDRRMMGFGGHFLIEDVFDVMGAIGVV
jgi:hypothetical protein